MKVKNKFKFDPGVFSRFGEELVPKPEQGIVELVRNSYDADARTCTVELIDTTTEGGKVRISDDGVGMDKSDIREGWFIIGHSRKASEMYTEKHNRRVSGDKGIGRLSALRLGTEVEVHTRPECDPGVEYHFIIDWTEYENVDTVDEVSFSVGEKETDKKHGTDIYIKDLQVTLTKRNVEYLSRELILLSDPFNREGGFSTRLVSKEFKSKERKTNRKYFDDAEYHLLAEVDESGLATARLVDWKGDTIEKADHEEIAEGDAPYTTVPAEFDLWWFKLKSEGFSNRNATIKEVRNWLSEFGGVHFYHGDLRVRPYGDPGHDWLQLNFFRARSPEKRPSTNNSIGRVKVEDSEEKLVQKTDRQGFVESPYFEEIRNFCQDAVDWLSRLLKRKREEERQKRRDRAPKKSKDAEEELDNVLESPEKDKDDVEDKVESFKKAKDNEIKNLKKDLQLYRSLATAGVTSSTFAHEASTPITQISRICDVIEKRTTKGIEINEKGILSKAINKIRTFLSTLSAFTSIPIKLLKKSKRRTQVVKVNERVEEIIDMFGGYFEDANIEVEKKLSDSELEIKGSEALVESIIINLITNSVKAFNNGGTSGRDRIFRIETTKSRTEREAVMKVMDSGPGIESMGVNEIWTPGRTTYEEGTGFGLTIVKDSVGDLDGNVKAKAHGELGGAEFIVSFPLNNPDFTDEHDSREGYRGDGAPAKDRHRQ